MRTERQKEERIDPFDLLTYIPLIMGIFGIIMFGSIVGYMSYVGHNQAGLCEELEDLGVVTHLSFSCNVILTNGAKIPVSTLQEALELPVMYKETLQ